MTCQTSGPGKDTRKIPSYPEPKKKTKFEKRRCCPKDAAKVVDGIDIPFRFENKKYNRQMARESEESWRN